ncbi:MAG: hypothetical protein M1350_06325 [Actinobacteria bacterium]|nr:hypothetical protein [Actinomycetota bacterium]
MGDPKQERNRTRWSGGQQAWSGKGGPGWLSLPLAQPAQPVWSARPWSRGLYDDGFRGKTMMSEVSGGSGVPPGNVNM